MGKGVYFVERDSYAIALFTAFAVEGVTRWGLFLMRGVHLFLGPMKAEFPHLWRIGAYTLGLLV
jgi:hypothetical protein